MLAQSLHTTRVVIGAGIFGFAIAALLGLLVTGAAALFKDRGKPNAYQARVWRRLILDMLKGQEHGLTGQQIAIRMPNIRQRWLNWLLDGMEHFWITAVLTKPPQLGATGEPEGVPHDQRVYTLTEVGRRELENAETVRILSGHVGEGAFGSISPSSRSEPGQAPDTA